MELDHFLETFIRKPGALPGATALEQARAASTFTPTHEVWWAAACKAHGDADGTRALIEVLLLHRHMPHRQVLAGVQAALKAGALTADVVALEARKAAETDETTATATATATADCTLSAATGAPDTTPVASRRGVSGRRCRPSRHTPRGTGLNNAFADGFDLGWKLSWVHRGWADDPLLDTYEAERRPVADHNIARSLDPLGSRRTAQTELPYDLNGRLPHQWISDGWGRRSSIDLVTTGLTRLSIAPPTRPAAGGGNRTATPPITDHRLDRRTATLLGADRPGGLLIRPDGVPVAA